MQNFLGSRTLCLEHQREVLPLGYYFVFNLFIFGCVGTSLLRAGFLQLWQAGATLRCSAQASHCGGFSCCGVRALGTRALEHRLSSCGSRAQLLRGMWDLPGPGVEPMSPALAGRFLTTAPPGEAPGILFFFF